MKLLIDGDLLLYRTGFAIERTKYLVELINPTGYTEYRQFDDKKSADGFINNTTTGVAASANIWSRKDLEPVEHGYKIVDSVLSALADKYIKTKDDSFQIYISGNHNFRDKLWTTAKYKGNRDGQAKPSHFKLLKDYLVGTYSAEITDGIEADDAIGIASGADTICVSLDKDLDQIVGTHYNWVTGEEYVVSPKEAKSQFYIQLLAGDPTDNIGGLPGVGVVRATKALADCASPKEMMEVAAGMYQDEFGEEWFNRLLETAQLVYILRHENKFWASTKDFSYLQAIRDRYIDAQAA